MRIIAGNWRGRKIIAPKGDVTRPTADRTRERLFSMMVSRLGDFADLRILDLFSGSGALGLEALSRGGAHCTFVEQDRDAIAALEKNIASLGAGDICEVKIGSVLHLGPARQAYDVILMDPPYDSGAGAVALDKLARHGWFAPSSWIAIETSKKETVMVKGFDLETVRDSGLARLHILRPAGPNES